MGRTKKPAILASGIARLTIDQASKAGLVDLVRDFLILRLGREDASDEEIAAAFVEAFEPVALARGDTPPRVVRPPVRRASRPAAAWCLQHRRLLACCPCSGTGER